MDYLDPSWCTVDAPPKLLGVYFENVETVVTSLAGRSSRGPCGVVLLLSSRTTQNACMELPCMWPRVRHMNYFIMNTQNHDH